MGISAPPAIESPLTRYARWSLAVTVAAMPLYVFRFKLLILPTTPLEVLILATIVLYAAGRWQAGSWSPVRTGIEIPTALLLLAALVATAVSTDHVGALGFYRAYFIEPVALFYVALDLLRKPDHFRTALLGFAIGSAVFAALNLGAWAIAVATHVRISSADAPEALYTSPNSVAIFLEPPIAIAAGFALYAQEKRDRIVAIASLVFLLPAMLLTLSRAGWLTMTAFAVIVLVTLPQRRLKLALLGSGAVALVALYQIGYVRERLFRQLDPTYQNNTFEGRLQIWSDTLHMLRDHPIFGAGLRAYAIVMKPYVTTPARTPELYPHNLFLAMWAELGLLGLIAFVVLLGLLLWRGWTSYAAATGFARPLLWGTSAAFVAIVLHGVFDTPYYNNDISVEFWFLAALEIAAIKFLLPVATRKEGSQR